MKNFLKNNRFIPKDNFIKKIIIEYEVFSTNCDQRHAEKKAEIFLEHKKQGISVPSKECV